MTVASAAAWGDRWNLAGARNAGTNTTLMPSAALPSSTSQTTRKRYAVANIPTENDLRTRLNRYGQANWVGRSTTTHAQQLQIAQACVDALDQFDKYEADISDLRQKLKWQQDYSAAQENEVKRAGERKRQWELEPPHCSTCSCEALPAQFLKPPDVPAEGG